MGASDPGAEPRIELYTDQPLAMEDDRISPMTQMRGVGSRPITLNNKNVKATSLGGTVEKLEMGMTGETSESEN